MILLEKEKLSENKTHLRNTPPLPKPQSNQKYPESTHQAYQQPAPHPPAPQSRRCTPIQQKLQVKMRIKR